MSNEPPGKVGAVWLIHLGEPLSTDAGSRPYRYGSVALALSKQGWRVVRWAPTFDHFSRRMRAPARGTGQVLGPAIEVRLIEAGAYRNNASLQRLVFHLRASWSFWWAASNAPRPSVVVCSTPAPELAAVCALFCVANRIPLIIDIRDLWPDALMRHLNGWRRLARPWFRLWWRTGNSVALRLADGILAVSDEYLEWGLRIAGRTRKSNDAAIPIGAPRVGGIPDPADRAAASPLGCVFFGTLSEHFDFEAMVRVAEALPTVQFHVCGDGPLRELVEGASRRYPNVRHWGWVSAMELRSIGAMCHVGLLPYASDAAMSSTNKLAEYLSLGLPVMGSLRSSAMNPVIQAGAGWYFAPSDVHGMVSCLSRLNSDRRAWAVASSAARSVFESRFESSKLADDVVMAIARVESRYAES